MMKRVVYILPLAVLLISCLLLGSCGDNSRATALLSRADSLMADRPDSALQILDGCETEVAAWPESQQMRHRLLQAKGRNKAYVPFTSDSVMTIVVEYYDHHGTANEQMEAHYLLGCVYRDLGEAPKALSAYHDAVECADTTAVDCDYMTLCRVYGQMSNIYYYQNLYEDQLVSLDRAIDFGIIAKDTLTALLMYSQKVSAYKMLMMPDSMLYVCEIVAKQLSEIGYPSFAAGMLCFPVRYLCDQDSLIKAKRFLEIYERESGFFDENHNIAPGREVYYYTKGYYYLKTCQYDSAEYFFRKELATGKDFNNQNAGARGLAQLFQQTHKSDSAVKYALYSYAMNDSVDDHETTSEVARMKSLYDYTRYEHEAQKEKERADREREMTIIVIIIASLAASMGVYFYWLQRKRHRAAYQLAIRNLSEAQNTILHLRSQEAMLNSEIEKYSEQHDRMDELNSELANLKLSIKDYEEEIERQKAIVADFQQKEELTKETVDQKINQSDIYKRLRIIANQGQRLTDENWNQLMQLVISLLPNFYRLISSKERELSRLEYQICILDRLGIEPSRMQYLLEISESYVSRMRGGLHQKIFGTIASGKDFSRAIKTIC